MSVAVLMYDEADQVLPSTMELGTFIDLEATTSADNPVPAKDKDVVARATVNSKIMSITVDPPAVPPLQECVVITLEHKTRNKGNILILVTKSNS